MVMTGPDEIRIKGFTVEISGAGTREVDGAWETCTGGGLNIELADSSVGSDKNAVATPGHKYVDEITLRGPLTKGRKALIQWMNRTINDTAAGKQARFNLTLIEIGKDGASGRRFNYLECFITRYVYPKLSADGTANLYEEVSIKPERVELS